MPTLIEDEMPQNELLEVYKQNDSQWQKWMTVTFKTKCPQNEMPTENTKWPLRMYHPQKISENEFSHKKFQRMISNKCWGLIMNHRGHTQKSQNRVQKIIWNTEIQNQPVCRVKDH